MPGKSTTKSPETAVGDEAQAAARRERVKEILNRLEKAYPEAHLELNFSSPFELLIATILAAQCTDERVNQVTEYLFKKYRSPEDYLQVPIEELEEDIRPTGFYRNKAKSVVACCRMLVDEFGGRVPESVEELTRLPGVGRKTANIVRGNAMGQQAIGVDTHVKRVSGRLGLTHSQDPDKIELELAELIPQEKWTRSTLLLQWHGRYTCTARNPNCNECVVFDLCEWPQKGSS